MNQPWQTLIPETRGVLPSSEPVYRTDPGGSFEAEIAILGVYPAAKVKQMTVDGRRMNLPVQVERTSFEIGVSASGKDIDVNYLAPLGLSRDEVLLLDMMPYFLANRRGKKGKTMWDNILRYEAATEEALGIEPRPVPAALVEQTRTMPGNLVRLGDYLGRCKPRLLLTLGVEAAAFTRGISFHEADKLSSELFYSKVASVTVADTETEVVHLTHPGNLMADARREGTWWRRHRAWCSGAGRELVRLAL